MKKRQFNKMPAAIKGTEFKVIAFIGTETLENGLEIMCGKEPCYKEYGNWWDAFIHSSEPLVFVGSKVTDRPEWATVEEEELARKRAPYAHDFAWIEITLAKAEYVDRNISYIFKDISEGIEIIACGYSGYHNRRMELRSTIYTQEKRHFAFELLLELSDNLEDFLTLGNLLLNNGRIEFESNNYTSFIY
jgi:hypothetical protein